MPEVKLATYNDYPKERLDPLSSNEDMVCFFCKRPEKEIAGKLENHAPSCKWRQKKESQ